MAKVFSPLRYPGGKSCLYELVSRIISDNRLKRCHYAEPYAGGCGLALGLLYGGVVNHIHVNDVDPAIWAFWNGVLNDTESLVSRIESALLTMDEWHRQREVYLARDLSDPTTLGFSAFYLNRTNRSGVIKGAGAIGGQQQTGNYKMDCRFNKEDLVHRVRRVAKYRNRIHLTSLDAVAFMAHADTNLPAKSIFCIDPPYFNKGSSLYTSFYNPEDHAEVSQSVLGLKHPWILTYDNTPEITQLYQARRQFSFDLNYSLQTKRVGTELLVTSKGLKMPSEVRDRQIHVPKYRAINAA